MFKKILVMILSIIIILNLCACKNNVDDKIIVVEDTEDINFAIWDYDTMNPILTKSNNVESIMNIVYEPLFSINEKQEIVPILAEDYSMSSGGTKITVNLKENIKWQDGTNFTAEDVTNTISKIKNTDGIYKNIGNKIKNFTPTTKKQVVIELEEPSFDFAYFLTFPIISRNTEFISDDNFLPVGTGAYKFLSKTGPVIEFIPNLEWHGGENSKKKVVVKILNDEASALQSFNSNEIDAIFSDTIKEKSVAPKSNSTAKQVFTKNLTFLGFNCANEKLTENLRRAVGLLIDKDAIVEKCVYGFGVPTDFSVNPTSAFYSPISDKKKAKEEIVKLIESSGLILKDGVYELNGESVSFNIIVNENNTNRIAVANAVSENLRSFGIDSGIEILPYETYIERIKNDDFDMFLGEVETEEYINPCEMIKGNNYFNFDNSKINEELSKLFEMDKKVSKKSLSGLYKLMEESSPYVPLYYKTESIYYGDYVYGMTVSDRLNLYKNIEKWYFYTEEDGEKKDD